MTLPYYRWNTQLPFDGRKVSCVLQPTEDDYTGDIGPGVR
jgi:hypothetical protein